MAEGAGLTLAQMVKEGVLNQTMGTISGYDVASGTYSLKSDGGSASERNVALQPENVRALTISYDNWAGRHSGRLPTRTPLRHNAHQRQLNDWMQSAGAAWARS